jgi:hypothetical protein
MVGKQVIQPFYMFFRPRPQILSPPVYIDFLHSYAEIIFKYGCSNPYDNTILISDYAIKVVWR